jgi:hypothetical protein
MAVLLAAGAPEQTIIRCIGQPLALVPGFYYPQLLKGIAAQIDAVMTTGTTNLYEPLLAATGFRTQRVLLGIELAQER